MAIVRVEIFKRSQEVRDAIIKGITEVMVANGAKVEGTQVIIYEIEPNVWGQGGETYEVRMARRAAEAAQHAEPAGAEGGEQQR